MQTWLALFRGINVGGKNKMSMAMLRAALESTGCRSVQTYIQSGNAVFSSPTKSKRILSKRLTEAIEDQFGFCPIIVLRSDVEFRHAIENCPFPVVASDQKTVHFFFLDSIPVVPDMEGIAKLANPSESYKLVDAVFYLHAPNGIGLSKLAAGAERKLGVLATARNYTTINNLAEILDTRAATDRR